MANIKLNNTRKLDFKIRKDEYWDLMLSKDETYGAGFDWDDTACLAAFVTPEIDECIEYFDKGKVFSSTSWDEAVNSGDDEFSGVTLYNIGLTGVDNALVFYDKNLISNQEFFNYQFRFNINICPFTSNTNSVNLVPRTSLFNYFFSIHLRLIFDKNISPRSIITFNSKRIWK